MRKVFLLLLFTILDVNYIWAGGVAERQQAIKDAYRHKAEEAQYKAVEQKILEQQAQQKAVYEQAVQQRRLEQERVAAEQVLRQRQAIEQKKAYEQGVQYKKAGQEIQARQAAQAVQEAEAYKQKKEYQDRLDQKKSEEEGFDPSSAEDVVDFKDVLISLQSSSEVWPLMMEMEPKVIAIGKYINDFKQQGVTISKTAESYVHMIDQMSSENPEMLHRPFKDLLQMAAIIEYDFDNGESKDQLALKLLGQKAYFQNRKRLGLD